MMASAEKKSEVLRHLCATCKNDMKCNKCGVWEEFRKLEIKDAKMSDFEKLKEKHHENKI